MIWHDCKIDPPNKSGNYLLWFLYHYDNDWNKVYYNIINNEWLDPDKCIPYGNSNWGWSDFIPYKWAEIDLSEVK